jgi:hypothetical protein
MFKIVSLVVIFFVSLAFIGCNEPKANVRSHKMFQTVTQKEATIAQTGEHKASCSRCGMDLVRFYKTNHLATIGDKKYQYCSIHCLEDHLGEGVTLKNPKVVDLKSLKFIPVNDAYYVVGSKVRGTMSKISKYAFATLDDAKKFQAEHGGEIMNFTKAREIAQKDFKYYR